MGLSKQSAKDIVSKFKDIDTNIIDTIINSTPSSVQALGKSMGKQLGLSGAKGFQRQAIQYKRILSNPTSLEKTAIKEKYGIVVTGNQKQNEILLGNKPKQPPKPPKQPVKPPKPPKQPVKPPKPPKGPGIGGPTFDLEKILAVGRGYSRNNPIPTNKFGNKEVRISNPNLQQFYNNLGNVDNNRNPISNQKGISEYRIYLNCLSTKYTVKDNSGRIKTQQTIWLSTKWLKTGSVRTATREINNHLYNFSSTFWYNYHDNQVKSLGKVVEIVIEYR